MRRKPYPSDLTNKQWAIVEPLIPSAQLGGPSRSTDMREVVNAIFYILGAGCAWKWVKDTYQWVWQVVKRDQKPRFGFKVLPWRWIVERTNARVGAVPTLKY